MDAATNLALAWGSKGPKTLGPLERAEAAAILEMLVTASMRLTPPDVPALYYVAGTAALLEVCSSIM